jgi:hypothetical protein
VKNIGQAQVNFALRRQPRGIFIRRLPFATVEELPQIAPILRSQSIQNRMFQSIFASTISGADVGLDSETGAEPGPPEEEQPKKRKRAASVRTPKKAAATSISCFCCVFPMDDRLSIVYSYPGSRSECSGWSALP